MPDNALDQNVLRRFTETPSVGTACGPMVAVLTEFFGSGWTRTLVPDGFCLFQRSGAVPEQLRAVFVAHMDEVGGVAYGPVPGEADRFACRFWGTDDPERYAGASLQAFDYLEESSIPRTFPVVAEISDHVDSETPRLALRSAGDSPIRPYRTAFTFDQATVIDDRYIHAKAVDPRGTLYAVCSAVRRLDDPSLGAMIVMAEECAMDVARKAVTFLGRRAPSLELVVNADVPSVANLGEADLDLPAIRVFEGHNFIDPSFGIRVATQLIDEGVKLHLTGAKSGSQTLLFTPLAPTLSIALPAENIHTACGKMSLVGISRCTDLIATIGERLLSRRLAPRS